MNTKELSDLIRNRRSIYPHEYLDKSIPKEVIIEILENANYAPTYKKTEPWRFKVIQGKKRAVVGHFIANFYKANSPSDKFNENKFHKIIQKPQDSAVVVAICMQRDPKERLDEWEEISAVAMAVQNMWLTCTTHNIGCYWGTPKASINANELFEMEEGEKCLGFFFMGYVENANREQKRTSVLEKVIWVD